MPKADGSSGKEERSRRNGRNARGNATFGLKHPPAEAGSPPCTRCGPSRRPPAAKCRFRGRTWNEVCAWRLGFRVLPGGQKGLELFRLRLLHRSPVLAVLDLRDATRAYQTVRLVEVVMDDVVSPALPKHRLHDADLVVGQVPLLGHVAPQRRSQRRPAQTVRPNVCWRPVLSEDAGAAQGDDATSRTRAGILGMCPRLTPGHRSLRRRHRPERSQAGDRRSRIPARANRPDRAGGGQLRQHALLHH